MSHPLFQQYPLTGETIETSAGPQPTPYHVYDGHAILIGGTADLARVQNLLEQEQVVPVQTQSGRTLMAVWAVEETEASLGPHSELQISFYVSHQPMAPIADSAFALLHYLLNEPDARQMCHGLWNDTEVVVAYNREVLGLSPHLASYTFEREDGRIHFSFHDAECDRPIVRGDVRERKRPSIRAILSLAGTLGVVGSVRAASTKVIRLNMVNPRSEVLPWNADALVVSSSDDIVPQLYDSGRDSLEIFDDRYSSLDFKPTFIEHMRGFKFVYLNPQHPLTGDPTDAGRPKQRFG